MDPAKRDKKSRGIGYFARKKSGNDGSNSSYNFLGEPEKFERAANRRCQRRQLIMSLPSAGGANAEPAQLFQLVMLRALLLPPRCRDVFVLKEIHGYTPAEIAAALGISTTDVNRHLRKAMREVGEK